MRSVRCDACGTRALMAASKCPKCAHEIEVRNGFGEMLPLSHCSTCDSYYPTRLGSCRWCGTKPERAPVGPFVWKGVGIATFVAMAWGAWLVHDDPPAAVQEARLAAVLKPDSAAGSLDSSLVAASIVVDSGVIDSLAAVDSTDVGASDSTIATVATVVAALSDSLTEPRDTTPVASEPVASEPVPERTPEERAATAPRSPARSTTMKAAPRRVASSVKSPAKSATKTPGTSVVKAPTKTPAKTTVAKAATPKSRTRSTIAKAPTKATTKPRATRAVWVNSVARNWTIVRAGADRGARVIASIGPNTRVQLGESRGGWRRIRAKGLAGWVEHRSFFSGAGTSRKTGSLASR